GERGRRGVRRGVGEPERVAVRLRPRDRLSPDHAASADPIIDDDLLAEALGQFLADDAGDSVGAAAGLERHDKTDWPLHRPALRMSEARPYGRGEKAKNNAGHDESP